MKITIRTRLRQLALPLLGGLLIASIATGCNQSELAAIDQGLVNTERASRGLAPLSWDNEAGQKAQVWAEKMAAEGRIFHSVVADGIDSNWLALGENVGVSPDVRRTHQLFMQSPTHAAAILSSRYTHIGVGVAERDGVIYVAEVFRG